MSRAYRAAARQGTWGGGATSMACGSGGAMRRTRGAAVRGATPAERRRDEHGPWGGGATSRACGVAARRANDSSGHRGPLFFNSHVPFFSSLLLAGAWRATSDGRRRCSQTRGWPPALFIMSGVMVSSPLFFTQQ
jgi:hypothetical protein